MNASWGGRAAAFVVAAAVSLTFFINFCDLVYDCGCRSYWRGAAATCNIHQAEGPHCPWCSYGLLGAVVPQAAILAAQALIAFWPGRLRLWARLVGALVAFPIVGGIVAVVFGLVSGYWS